MLITNVNFEHLTGGEIDFISANDASADKRYAHNVTVKECSFTGNDNSNVVATRFRQCYNITVENCTATKLHSLMWASGTAGININEVEVTEPVIETEVEEVQKFIDNSNIIFLKMWIRNYLLGSIIW